MPQWASPELNILYCQRDVLTCSLYSEKVSDSVLRYAVIDLIMRKYRSSPFTASPVKTANWLKNTNFLYIFVSWNIFAVCLYKWYTKRRVKDQEKWQKMTASKYTLLVSCFM